MEETARLPEGSGAPISDFTLDLDLINELFSEDVWLGLTNSPDVQSQVTGFSLAPFDSSGPFPPPKTETRYGNDDRGGDAEASTSSRYPPQFGSQTENLIDAQLDQGKEPVEAGTSNSLSIDRISSLKGRIMQAIGWIKEAHGESDVLVQLWIPTKKENNKVLTTYEQPFSLNPNCQRLINYRTISTNYQFPTEENTDEILGLPGRVFLGKLPEWSPDVRYFSSKEYARVNYAQHYDMRGSLALPIFERSGQTCVGVLEVVMTTEKINYRSDLENICNALQAVDLRSSDVPTIPRLKMEEDSYVMALPEISAVLRTVCETHNLPLAQTWVPCMQQGKSGSRHSDQNYTGCVSTVDGACLVLSPSLFGFHAACSEHHLLRGQGVVGQAFTTNQPCFSSDVSSYTKTEYPLSDYARMFGLRAAVAIRLRSVDSGNCDYVLEFFLPVESTDLEEQKEVLHSLSSTMRGVCRTLRVISEKELQEEAASNACDAPGPGQSQLDGSEVNVELLTENTGKGKAAEKRRLKMEKTISLEVLQQHFSGSLKDAAKSIGVCPTTLKRICRQHGISRWPSRKIKKVDHSLRKLQVVIDSIQGVNGALQLSSLYSDFPQADAQPQDPAQKEIPMKKGLGNPPSLSNSPSSSCSHSSGSSPSSSHRATEPERGFCEEKETEILKRARSEAQLCHRDEGGTRIIIKSQSFQSLGENSPLPRSGGGMVPLYRAVPGEDSPREQLHSLLRVKATHGKEKVRFRLQPAWRFRDLKQEIGRRFGIDRSSSMELKYLDDDSEWVLLTCDADLQECRDIHRSTGIPTVKISVAHPVSPRIQEDVGGHGGH